MDEQGLKADAGGRPHLNRRGRPPTPQLREKILRSAEELFGAKEFHLVLTDEVAAHAGVGKGSLYRQFGSKEELYAAAVIDGFARLQDEIREALAKIRLRPRAHRDGGRHTLSYFWHRRRFFTILHDPSALPVRQAEQYFAHRAQLSQLVSALLAEGVSCNALRANLDLRLASESLMGMLRGMNFYRPEEVTLDEAVRTAVAIFLDGCGIGDGYPKAA